MAQPRFVYTNPEAARQAIAEIQLQAALAENQSRENIAREQTAAQRYATQAQINEREKDRAVDREAIASRSGVVKNSAALGVQFETVARQINDMDPPTVRELEALFAANPQLTEDHKNLLRAERERAYKTAKANAANGNRAAQSYMAELAAMAKSKTPDTTFRESLLKRIDGDKDVFLDRVSGAVTSRYQMPREDFGPGAGRASGQPTQSSILGGPRAAGGIPTIGELQARATGSPRAISPAQDYGGAAAAPPTRSQIGDAAPVPVDPPVTAVPPSYGTGAPFGIPSFSGIPIRVQPYGAIEFGSRTPRAADIAVPPAAAVSPPSFAIPSSPMGATDRWLRMMSPQEPAGSLPPRYGPEEQMVGPMDNPMRWLPPAIRVQPRAPSQMDQLLRMLPQMPEFARLPGREQQAILDEITGGAATMPTFPRAYDLNALRPEYVPMDPY